MGSWSDAGSWRGDELRRETFFFPSRGMAIFGSAYAPADVGSAAFGVVFCNSWGYEGNLAAPQVHWASIAVARAGGVAFHFHYPGFGDSEGEDGTTTIDAMVVAAGDAVAEASRRYPDLSWALGGLMLGASVAALAADRDEVERLLLIQPALRPAVYFARLEHASRRSLGGPAPEPAPGFAYGYRLSPQMIAAAAPADAAVDVALAGFGGEGAVVCHRKPASVAGAPERFDEVRVEGVWRFGARARPPLAHAAASWLCERARVAAAR